MEKLREMQDPPTFSRNKYAANLVATWRNENFWLETSTLQNFLRNGDMKPFHREIIEKCRKIVYKQLNICSKLNWLIFG